MCKHRRGPDIVLWAYVIQLFFFREGIFSVLLRNYCNRTIHIHGVMSLYIMWRYRDGSGQRKNIHKSAALDPMCVLTTRPGLFLFTRT